MINCSTIQPTGTLCAIPELLMMTEVMTVMIWGGVTIVLIFVSCMILLKIRKNTIGKQGAYEQDFSLLETRNLCDEGQLTPEEFRKIRLAVLGVKDTEKSDKNSDRDEENIQDNSPDTDDADETAESIEEEEKE